MQITATTGPAALTPAHLDADVDPVRDGHAYWYAFGRFDQGHPPVAYRPGTETLPSATSSAWLFGRMWAMLDPDASGPGLPTAFDNFVATRGHSLLAWRCYLDDCSPQGTIFTTAEARRAHFEHVHAE